MTSVTSVPTSATAPTDAQRAAAADPDTPAGRLLVLAGDQPRLREVIGRNPACPPELRSWIARAQDSGERPGGPSRAGGPSQGAADGSHQRHGDVPQEASWAPHGWEPSDVGLGPDPFRSVLGDPLTGSPLSDVSVYDGVYGEDWQTAPEPGRQGRRVG